jgi:hypothetical protein
MALGQVKANFALCRLVEVIMHCNLETCINFIDFSMVFNLLHRGQMMKNLRAYGISDRIMEAIKLTYMDTSVHLMVKATNLTTQLWYYNGVSLTRCNR